MFMLDMQTENCVKEKELLFYLFFLLLEYNFASTFLCREMIQKCCFNLPREVNSFPLMHQGPFLCEAYK